MIAAGNTVDVKLWGYVDVAVTLLRQQHKRALRNELSSLCVIIKPQHYPQLFYEALR
jgi:hypothetical protein